MARYKRLDILIMQKNKLLENQDNNRVPAADVTMLDINNNSRIRNEQGQLGNWNRLTLSPENPQELRIKQLEVQLALAEERLSIGSSILKQSIKDFTESN